MGWFGKKNDVVVSNTVTAIAGGDRSVAISGAMIGNVITGDGNRVISLEKKVAAARISLSKEVPFAIKMSVRAYVDRSGSMHWFYQNGMVQLTTERATGFAIAMDDDGKVPVGSFGSGHISHGEMMARNYQGFVNANIRCGGGTDLSASLADLEKAAKKTTEPIYALIITDGAPNDRADVKKRLERLSKLPVFVKLLVVGNDPYAWEYVQTLDNDNSNRGIDNVNAQKIDDPSKLSDQQFADKMTEELHTWYRAAKDAGII